MDNMVFTSIPIEELKSIMVKCIREELQKIYLQGPQPEINEDLLSRKEASRLLKISTVTLSKYVKSGKVKAHRIARKVYFKKNELFNAMQKMRFKIESDIANKSIN